MKRKILFVSHDATRTGAPIVLLSFLNWLKKNTDTEITILFKAEGILINDFREAGEAFCWQPNTPKTFKHDLYSRIKRRIKKENPFVPFPQELREKNFDLVFLNTVATLDLAPLLKERYKCPVVAHVHEMEYSINAIYPDALSPENKCCIDYYFAVSEEVKQNLINHQIPANDIALLNEFIDIVAAKNISISASSIKEELNIQGHFVVGGAGLSSWRKGADLFLYTAALVKKKYPAEKIKFVWVGALEHQFITMLNYELSKLGLSDEIIFTGEKELPQNYFQVFDIFLLTSREDPFPLVALEAATLAKPVVCFQQSGGINEFIKSGAGLNVEYGNIEAMASTIIRLKRDKQELNALADAAEKTAVCYDVNVMALKLYNKLCSVISGTAQLK